MIIGIPAKIICYNGPHFVNEILKRLSDKIWFTGVRPRKCGPELWLEICSYFRYKIAEIFFFGLAFSFLDLIMTALRPFHRFDIREETIDKLFPRSP